MGYFDCELAKGTELIEKASTKDYVCAECFTKQGDNITCTSCGAPRVVAIKIVVELFGADWETRLTP